MIQFELTKLYLEEIRAFIDAKKDEELSNIFAELHPADIAEIMDAVNLEEAQYIYRLLEGEVASDVLLEIAEDDRQKLLEELPAETIARLYLENMDTDDAADVVGELPEDKQEEVLSLMEDLEHAGEIVDLLNYDEDTAGGIMGKELVVVNENWTVQHCLREISLQAEDIDEIYYVYVVNDDEILKGILSLKKLIQYSTQTKISNIFTRDVIQIMTDASQEEVAMTMQKYDLVAIPVVDAIGRLQGRITIDDVVDIIREEADRDYQMVSGITGDVESTDSIRDQTRARLPWLIIGLFGGLLGALVIGAHETALSVYPQLAMFIPMITAMGGNVGVQSSSIVVQSLASGTTDFNSTATKLMKELGVAIITATILSLIVLGATFFIYDNIALTLSVGVSLFAVIVFASLVGTFIPLALNRLKIDPALATGPFITTLNDIIGLMIYMGIGKILFDFFS